MIEKLYVCEFSLSFYKTQARTVRLLTPLIQDAGLAPPDPPQRRPAPQLTRHSLRLPPAAPKRDARLPRVARLALDAGHRRAHGLDAAAALLS